MRPRFKFRNPPFMYRVIIVAAFFTLPGALAGALASLFVPRFPTCMIVGAAIGAFAGAWLEAGADILHRDE